MEDRAAFVNEDTLLESRQEPFDFDVFLSRSAQLASTIVENLDPDGPLDPFLVIANGGELLATMWTLMSPEYQENFVDQVIPATLLSYDVSMVALLATSHMTPGGSSDTQDAEEVVLLNALDLTYGMSPGEAAFAARIHRGQDRAPEVGMFVGVGGGISPGIRAALHEGCGSQAD